MPRAFDSAQIVYNMLNPSAAAEHCRRIIRRRIMDGCSITPRRPASASSASACWPAARCRARPSVTRLPSPAPEPIGSAMSYDADIDRARRLMPLVEEGFAGSLTEAATRFALSHPAMGTILVGMATPQQFEDALAAVEKGPLPQAALDRLSALRQAFSGEPR